MFKIDGKTIHITRGDACTIEVSAKLNENENYTFKVGDVVRLNVFDKRNPKNVVLTKDALVNEECEVVDICLIKGDTKIGNIIKKQKSYWYEIELNPDTVPQTIIGCDETEENEFILYPEGGNE